MKKKLLLVLILIFAGAIVFGATKNIQQMVFGIEKSDFQSLNITDDQKEKIGKLLKEYGAELDKLDAKNKKLKVSTKGLENNLTDQVKLQYKLYGEFKKILTKEQLSKYEKAYFVKLAEQKLYLTKKFSAFEEPLGLDEVQKDKYRYLINNFDGDLLKLEADFVALLTAKQKIIYNHLKERQMNTLLASGTTSNSSKSENLSGSSNSSSSGNTNGNSNGNSSGNANGNSSGNSSGNSNDSSVKINNNNGSTEVKTDGKNVVINNNNGPSNGAVIAGSIVQPVLWWSIGTWCARPIYYYNWRGYDRYWNVYDREWCYWDGYWDGRWDQYWEQQWEKHWDDFDFEYEQWRYEERIYDTGFTDGVEYDKKLYDKWADDPFDESKGEYIESDVSDYDPYKDVYEDAKLDYDLGKYYDEKNHDWNYEKVSEDWGDGEREEPEEQGEESVIDQPKDEPKGEETEEQGEESVQEQGGESVEEQGDESVEETKQDEPVVAPEPKEEPVVEPEQHEEPAEDHNDFGGNDNGGDDFGGGNQGGGDFGGGDFGGGDFGGGDFGGGDW